MLSIITINYNNSEGLRRTAQSICQQDVRNLEWIVIDGASTDSSRQVIDEYSDIITYWVSEPDRGIYHAMNKGVDVANGSYLLFLNSGDALYDSSVIADFYALAPKDDVIYGREVGVDADGKVVWEWQFPPEPLQLSYFWEHALKHQAMFISKRCFEKHRYNEEHRINSDVELTIALLLDGYKFTQWDRLVARFDTGGVSSVSNDTHLKAEELNDTINRLLPPCIQADYAQLAEANQLDVLIKAREISYKGRRWRWALRLWLYPLHWLACRNDK